jgi:hypothetical protein
MLYGPEGELIERRKTDRLALPKRLESSNRYFFSDYSVVNTTKFYKIKGGDGYLQDGFVSEEELEYADSELRNHVQHFANAVELEIFYYDNKTRERKNLLTTVHIVHGDKNSALLLTEGVTASTTVSSFKAALDARKNSSFSTKGALPTVIMLSDLHSDISAKKMKFRWNGNREWILPFGVNDHDDMHDYAALNKLVIIAVNKGSIFNGSIIGTVSGSLGAWSNELILDDDKNTIKKRIITDGALRARLETDNPLDVLRHSKQFSTDWRLLMKALLDGPRFIASSGFESHLQYSHLTKQSMQERRRRAKKAGEKLTFNEVFGSTDMPPFTRTQHELLFKLDRLLQEKIPKKSWASHSLGWQKFVIAWPSALLSANNTVWRKDSTFTGDLVMYYSLLSSINSLPVVLGAKEFRSTLMRIKKVEDIQYALDDAKLVAIARLRQLYPNMQEITFHLDSQRNHRSLGSQVGLSGQLSKC